MKIDADPIKGRNSKKVGLIRTTGASLAVGLAALSGCVDNSTLAKLEKMPSVEEQAALIGQTLSDGKVYPDATIERGFEIPHTANMPEHAVAAVNPLKLGKNRYAFMLIDREGDVAVKIAPEGTELQPASTGDDRFHPVEQRADISLVYNEYNSSAEMADQPEKYYRVVVGNRPGNIEDLVDIDPNLPPAAQNDAYNQQIGAIESGRVGDIAYYGK